MVVDTETSGFYRNSEVLAVAVIDTCGKVCLDGVSLPTGPISYRAMEVHGLTHRRLRQLGARSWPNDVHGRLFALFSRASLVLAWNAAFDRRMLNQTAHRHGLQLPDRPWLCVMRRYATARPGRRRTLVAAAADLGVRASGAHSALGDATTTFQLARTLAGAAR